MLKFLEILRIKNRKILPIELEDFEEALDEVAAIVRLGASKYKNKNWLEDNGTRCSHKEMHDSMFHHLAESFAEQRHDKESLRHPLAHLITRALMYRTRNIRGIVHSKDKK